VTPEAISRFNSTGLLHLPGAALSVLADLEAALARWPDGNSGIRIAGDPAIRKVLDGEICGLVAALADRPVFPVRATYFDKNDTNNWSLGWHQDRTIAVAERAELSGFGPWTTKQGILHVQPPFEIIAGLRTIRIHLDPTPQDNAPLLVAAGSHRLGLIPAGEADAIAKSREVMTCLAQRGDVWAYHTPVLHASERSAAGQRRRVLQVDYAAEPLPTPLNWLGV